LLYPYISEVFKLQGIKEEMKDIRSADKLIDILKVSLIYELEHLVSVLKKDSEHSYDAKWNKIYQVEIAKVSKLHGVYMTALAFRDGLRDIKIKKHTKDVLELLLKIYACNSILKLADYAFLNDYVDASQLHNIQTYYEELIEQVRPHMSALSEVATLDDLMYHDTILASEKIDY